MGADILKRINEGTYIEDFIRDLAKEDERYIDIIDNIDYIDGSYEWKIPTCRALPKNDGGFREIFVYQLEDRVAQKMLNYELSELFDTLLPKCTYAYRKGVNRLHAVRDILSETANNYSCKIDIKNYFRAVPYEVIEKSIDSLDIDSETRLIIKNHFKIRSYILNNEVITDQNLGLTAGSPLGAFFANYLLVELDKVMENSCMKYARYCDDMLLVSESKESLEENIKLLKYELSKYGLEVKDAKTVYFNPGDNINFLGLKIEKGKIDISIDSFVRNKKKIKKICKKYRTMISKNVISKEEGLVGAINAIAKYYYKENIYDEKQYKPLSNILSVVNTIDTVRELDFYTINNLRWVYTGKHNSMNAVKVPMEELYRLGYIHFSELYMDYKNEREIYKYKVRTL